MKNKTKELSAISSVNLDSNKKIELKPKIFLSRVKNHSEKRIELCPCHNPLKVKPKLKQKITRLNSIGPEVVLL